MGDATQMHGASSGGVTPPWLTRFLVGPYSVLAGNRPLRLLALRYAFFTLGTWLALVSLTILTYTVSRSATATALITFAGLAPPALVAPLVGMLIDRVDIKAVGIGANVGCALCMIGLVSLGATTLWGGCC